MLSRLNRLRPRQKLLMLAVAALVVMVLIILSLFWTEREEPEPVRASTAISHLSPSGGVVGGGTQLKIIGTDFDLLNAGSLNIALGGNNCQNIQVDSSSQLSCQTPTGTAGAVDVLITDGIFSETITDGFTYLDITETDLALYYDAQYGYTPGDQIIYDSGTGNKFGYLGQNELSDTDEPVFGTYPHRFTFDGTDDMIDTTLNSYFAEDVTLEVWFRRSSNDLVTDGEVGERLISTYQLDTNATDCEFGGGDSGFWSYGGNACAGRHALGIQGQTVQAQTYGPAANQLSDSSFITSDWWHHAVLTYNSTTFENNIYINSALHSTYTEEAAEPAAGVIKIGTFLEQVNNFAGDIAAVRVYGRDLNQTEIEFNFNQEKDRFGFVYGGVQLSGVPEETHLGTYAISDQPITVSKVLDGITFVDRRSSFVSWTAFVSVTDLVSPISQIEASKIAIDPTVSPQTVVVGSGLYNGSGQAGYFQGPGVTRTLFENLGSNGGGQFEISPELSVDIPPFTRAQIYTGTITISVS